ncbi:MAG: MATE family efflux transporter [Prevotella sp.]|nr:MATE family efflux transporter [Prevotella sp.]
MNKRNGYLISKALHTFMWASILSSVAQLLSTMIDAIVVSNLIGPDAISAVNVSVPVLSLVSCLGILLGVGGSIVAAKAMGLRNMEEANRVFSVSLKVTLIFGLLISVVGYWLTPGIVGLVCPTESRIYPLAASYLQIIITGMVFMLGGFTLQSFVKTDGNPKLVMRAVVIGCIVNLVFDIIFIQVFDMGIAGSAWASVLSYIVASAVCLLHFRMPCCSLRFQLHAKITTGLGAIAKEGAPLSVNSLLLGVCTYFINTIVLHVAGDDGMYVWSLCLQLFAIMQLVLGGISTSIYAIGGLLAGERDMDGLSILTRRVLLYVCSVLAFIVIVMLAFPEVLPSLFGGSQLSNHATMNVATPIRIYALLLVPYAIVAVLRSLYQIIGFRSMSLILSITQLVAMVICVWLLAFEGPNMLWWGFPVSGLILLIATMLFSWQKHRQQPQLSLMTLIPQTIGGKSLNISIRLIRGDVINALNDIKSFLKECQVAESTVFTVRLCCEELLNNIIDYAVEKYPEKHFADIYIRLGDSQISVLLKDDGRPFNPIFKNKELREKNSDIDYEHLGLLLVTGESSSINYKYMYDQNMVFLTFQRTK